MRWRTGKKEALGVKMAETFLDRFKSKIEGWENRVDPRRVPRE
jgi:hypothetical protein